MDLNILLLLVRDGLTTGAIYALLGVALVLLFAVTRVLFVPQGEFVAFAALAMVAFDEGRVPGLAGLALATGALAALARLIQARGSMSLRTAVRIVGMEFGLPLLLWGLAKLLAPMQMGLVVSIPLTVLMVTVIGMSIYRIVFEPLAQASVLVLLIAAFGVHMALLGLGLYFFGPEGLQAPPMWDASFSAGPLRIRMHDVIVLSTVAVLMLGLWWCFARSLQGKALRASAVNRTGASLVGISTSRTGLTAFAVAAAIGAVSGILIGPMTTVYYDTGFMIGLKGLVAAVLGGLVSYPLTFVAALLLALFEAGAAFWASSYKEVLVFLLVLPVLLWRSLVAPHGQEDEE